MGPGQPLPGDPGSILGTVLRIPCLACIPGLSTMTFRGVAAKFKDRTIEDFPPITFALVAKPTNRASPGAFLMRPQNMPTALVAIL